MAGFVSSVLLTQAHQLAVFGLTQPQTIANVGLTQAQVLIANSLAHGETIRLAILLQAQVLLVGGVTHAESIQAATLTVAKLLQAHRISSVSFPNLQGEIEKIFITASRAGVIHISGTTYVIHIAAPKHQGAMYA